MKIKKMLGAGMIAVCLMTGCANLMVALYDNDTKIAPSENAGKKDYQRRSAVPVRYPDFCSKE